MFEVGKLYKCKMADDDNDIEQMEQLVHYTDFYDNFSAKYIKFNNMFLVLDVVIRDPLSTENWHINIKKVVSVKILFDNNVCFLIYGVNSFYAENIRKYFKKIV